MIENYPKDHISSQTCLTNSHKWSLLWPNQSCKNNQWMQPVRYNPNYMFSLDCQHLCNDFLAYTSEEFFCRSLFAKDIERCDCRLLKFKVLNDVGSLSAASDLRVVPSLTHSILPSLGLIISARLGLSWSWLPDVSIITSRIAAFYFTSENEYLFVYFLYIFRSIKEWKDSNAMLCHIITCNWRVRDQWRNTWGHGCPQQLQGSRVGNREASARAQTPPPLPQSHHSHWSSVYHSEQTS